ncbi:MAG: ABC transporter ATP-binding protein, partial [bacterium]|nr:ABC transporter ATP-binding protein [bacterium]
DAADRVLKGQASPIALYRELGMFLFVTLTFQAARYLKRWYMRDIVNNMKCDIRAGLVSTIFARPMTELKGEKVGDLMSRALADVDQVARSVQTTITEVWDTFLLMLSHFVALMIYSPKITAVASIPIPITLIIAMMLRGPLYQLSLKSREAASKVNIHLRHNVAGMALLRLFGREEEERGRLKKLLHIQLRWNVWLSMLQNGILPLYSMVAGLGVVAVVGLGGRLVIEGTWTIGTFTAYMALFLTMARRTNVAAQVFNTWHGAQASWERILKKLHFSGTGDINSTMTDQMKWGSVLQVSNLSFRYPQSAYNTLNDISFSASPGQIIGITGPVGSGKSTLATVLSGLYPYSGEITVGGVSLSSLRQQKSGVIAYMDSSHFVFSEDIKFNVGLGVRDKHAVLEGMAMAGLGGDEEGLLWSLDSQVGERGIRVSGGQRLRLALARALASEAQILLLDDPFSAVDIRLEEHIINNLRKNMGNRTILLFSHRLTSFAHSDQVLVLNKGTIVQRGSHHHLRSIEGLYAEIYLAQCLLGSEAV